MPVQQEHRVKVRASAERALEATAEAADIWGGDWQYHGTSGTLTLPVSVGIRHGVLRGEVSARQLNDEAEVIFQVQESSHHLHTAGLAVLLFGAFGGLILVAWPFYPVLIPLTPAGVILSLAAWFLVASRVKTRAEGEFFDLVTELLERQEGRDSGTKGTR